MNKQKTYAPSCDKNKEDILKKLKLVIGPGNQRLLEIASGTGQHAVFFAAHFPHVQWVCSDVAAKIEGINLWLKEAKLKNLQAPLVFEIGKDPFPKEKFDLVFVSNLLHYISWKNDKTLFKDLGNRLRLGSKVIFYGALNYNQKFTSESNEEFDRILKAEDPSRGIRNFEDVLRAMQKAGFRLDHDFEMPANNRLLVFQRLEHAKS